MPKFEEKRFHVTCGPSSLFTRVRQKMSAVRGLSLKTAHFDLRAEQRAPPVAELEGFNTGQWELMTADVRSDTGKFVKTAWRKQIDGEVWWVVIGLHNAVVTAFLQASGKTGLGPDVVREGEFYKFVDAVNRNLLTNDSE